MYILIFLYKKNNTIIIVGVLKLHISQGPAFCLGGSCLPTLDLTCARKASSCLPPITAVTPG